MENETPFTIERVAKAVSSITRAPQIVSYK